MGIMQQELQLLLTKKTKQLTTLKKHQKNEHYVDIIGRFVMQNTTMQMAPIIIVCADWERQNGQVSE